MISFTPSCTCGHLATAHHESGACGRCSCEFFRDNQSPHTHELRSLGEYALDRVRRDLARRKSVYPFFVLRFPDNHLDTVNLPGNLLPHMNGRESRHRIFAALRTMTDMLGVTAVITAADAWVGQQTEKGKHLTEEQFLAICACAQGFAIAVERGLVERSEAAVITVQTVKRAMTLTLPYKRNEESLVIGELMIAETDHMDGAMAMYPEGVTYDASRN